MLEGKEVEGVMGEYGEYSVDVKPDGNIEAEINAKVDRAFLGIFSVKGKCDLAFNLDLVGGLQHLVKDSKSSILVNLVSGVSKILRG